MRPALIVAVLSLFGCLGPLHEARAASVAEKLIPDCKRITAHVDEQDGWLWEATGCGKTVWCLYGGGDMHCVETHPETQLSREEKVARTYLWCPKGPIAREPLHGETSWAFFELTGCDRAAWCGDHDGKWECRAPDALELAVKQLAVETGCQPDQIAQVQRFATNTQHTYRLSACGLEYACIVPVMRPKDGTPVASSNFGSLLTCKQVPKAPAAVEAVPTPADVPPPPPAP